MRRLAIASIVGCSFSASHSVRAYHGADITYTAIDLYTYSINIQHHGNNSVDLPSIVVDFGDGSQATVLRTGFADYFLWPCEDLFRVSSYSVQHTYGAPGTYIISVPFQLRPAGLLNVPGPPPAAFCVQAMLRIDPALGMNSSPRFTAAMTNTQRIGNVLHHNPGIEENASDSIVYTFETPLGQGCTAIDGYVSFDLPAYPMTNVFIEQSSGAFAWDHPHVAGLYAVLLRASEWRNGQLIGYASRDMALCVTDDYLTGILDAGSGKSISLYPNPGASFKIQGILPQAAELRVHDIQGRPVMDGLIARAHEWISPDGLPPGTYLIELRTGGDRAAMLRWTKQ